MDKNLLELFENLLIRYNLEKLKNTRREWDKFSPDGEEKEVMLKLIDNMIKTK